MIAKCTTVSTVTNFPNVFWLVDMVAELSMYAYVNFTIIGSDNGLPPNMSQIILWTNADILWVTSLQWRQQVPVSNERRKFYQNFQGNTQQELLNLIKPTLWISQLHQNDDDRTPAEITRQLWHILSPLRCGQQGRQQWRTGRRHCRTPRSPTTQRWLWTPTPNWTSSSQSWIN